MNQKNQVRCPKCGSEQIHADKKGFSAGKAVAGVVLAGGVGLAAGAIGKDKIIITCLKCGNQFKPGEGNFNQVSDKPSVDLKYNDDEANIIICSSCGGRTIFGHNFCCECGKVVNANDKKELIAYPLFVTNCPRCNQLTTKNGKYCSKCGKEKVSNSGCAGVLLISILAVIVISFII
jgi:RNA polymerase subunit RPABC4/transcription elongation factor Spt4